MEYKDQVKDFLERGEENLNIIKKYNGYEFTEIFGKFITALIFIKENRNISQSSMISNGLTCKKIKNTYTIDFEKDTREFIRHLRNACCHYGITILPQNQEIYKVIFKDFRKIKGKIEKCEIEMNIVEIEKVYNFLLNNI